jgi:hypothetical protein
MKGIIDERTRRNKQLEKRVNTLKTELDSCGSVNAIGHAETPTARERELPRTASRQLLPFHDGNRKLYSTELLVAQKGITDYRSDQRLTKPLT